MGLTVQQLFDYIDGLSINKPGIIVKGIKDEKNVYLRIHSAHEKYYVDKVNKKDGKMNVEERNMLDQEELQMFKVKVMTLLSEIKVEDIFIE